MDTQRLLSFPTQSKAVQDHRRQTFWQILFPVILAGVVVVAVTVFLILTTGGSGNTQDTRWADISLIWLIIPALLVCLIFLVLLAAIVYGMAKLLGVLPGYAALAQYYVAQSTVLARSLGNKVSAPVIAVKSGWAGFHRLIAQMRGWVKR